MRGCAKTPTLEYPDGNNLQIVVLHFEGITIDGELMLSEESSDIRYFSQEETDELQIGPLDQKRMLDGFSQAKNTIICDDFVSFSTNDHK